jgi:hypothetical protein
MLSPEEAEPLFARATKQQMYKSGKETIVASSGNREFDYALAMTLSRLTDTFHVLPGFAYYDDHDGMNAFATTKRHFPRADGSVLFGKRFFLDKISKPEHPEVWVTATCAHEYGHILQYKRGLISGLKRGQRTVKRVELHADFLAGYFAGLRKKEKADYPAAVFAVSRYSGGDRNFSSRGHHGTPDERAAAVVRGFEIGHGARRGLGEVIQIGLKYVSRL